MGRRSHELDPSPAVDWIHSHGDECYFSIDYDPEWGILDSFAEALVKHARCAGCAAPPPLDFGSCPCGGDGPNHRSTYRIDDATWESELDPLWKRDRRRVYDWNRRKSRREAIEGSLEPSYSNADIALLRSIQNDACYYCGTSISGSFQVDHLEPLARGGSDGVGNIMLACAACNRAKWALSEAQFWWKLRRRWPAEEFARVRESAKAMKREKRRRLGQSGLRSRRER